MTPERELKIHTAVALQSFMEWVSGAPVRTPEPAEEEPAFDSIPPEPIEAKAPEKLIKKRAPKPPCGTGCALHRVEKDPDCPLCD